MQAINRRQLFTLVAAAGGAALAGCGFRLRGANLQFPFRTIFIAGSGTAMVAQLKRLLARHVQVIDQAAQADVVLTVTQDQEERNASALSASAKVREVELLQRFDFHVVDANGSTLIESFPLRMQRFVSYNENEATAKDEEFAILLQNMRNDAAQQILRKLAATRPTTQ